MAENSPPPSQDNTSSGQANIRESQSINRVEVTRMDVQRGEIRELQHELLQNVCDCIDDQTETLGNKLDDIKRTINQFAGVRAGGPGRPTGPEDQTARAARERVQEEKSITDLLKEIRSDLLAIVRAEQAGGEGSVRGLMSDVAAVQAEHKVLNKILAEGTLQLDKWFFLFRQGVLIQFQNNMRRLNERVFRAAQRFTDLENAIQAGKALGDEMMTLAKTGMANLTDFQDLFFTALLEQRDNILATSRTVRQLAEQGTFAMGEFGTNLREVGEAFHKARAQLREEGIDLRQVTRGFEEGNALLTELVREERRAGVRGTTEQILESKRFRRSFDTLRTIAAFTGQTAEAVLKAQKEQRKTVDELTALNILTQEQGSFARDNLTTIATVQPELAKLVEQLLGSGADQAGILREIQQHAPQLAALGLLDPMVELVQTTASASIRSAEGNAKFNRILENFRNIYSQTTGDWSKAVIGEMRDGNEAQLASIALTNEQIETLKKLAEIQGDRADKDDEWGAKLDEAITAVRNAIMNNLPPPLASIISAIGFNTFAIVRAIFASAGKGGFFRLFRRAGGPGGTPPGTPPGGAVGGAATRGAARGLAGRALMTGARFLGPIGAGITAFQLARATGLDQFLNDILGGPGGATLGTRIFDLLHGAEEAELTAPIGRTGGIETRTTPEGAKVPEPKPRTSQDVTLSEMKAQTASLQELIRLMANSNEINQGISTKIGDGIIRPERAAVDRRRRESDIEIFAGELGGR